VSARQQITTLRGIECVCLLMVIASAFCRLYSIGRVPSQFSRGTTSSTAYGLEDSLKLAALIMVLFAAHRGGGNVDLSRKHAEVRKALVNTLVLLF
jgi:hypothetical protein